MILVQNGEAIDRNLKGERLTLDDVMEEARAQQVDSLDQVKWAVLESNGSISIIPKEGGTIRRVPRRFRQFKNR